MTPLSQLKNTLVLVDLRVYMDVSLGCLHLRTGKDLLN